MALYTKRTWHKCEDVEVIHIFNEVVEKAKELYPWVFESCEPELWIDSSTTALGRCCVEYSRKYTSNKELQHDINSRQLRYKRGVILLSKYILYSKEQVRSTLCHELGHFVAPNENHGYLWKVRADEIGKQWGITNQRLNTTGNLKAGYTAAGVKKEEVKYIVECPQCHAQWKYKRMCETIKNPSRYSCVKCNKKLIRVK